MVKNWKNRKIRLQQAVFLPWRFCKPREDFLMENNCVLRGAPVKNENIAYEHARPESATRSGF